ncbi:hypothetical protein GUJ93_ZPchr0001g32621 [Zizania palustris]|uniref:NAC domain-containing protein n=1 Tax=Zizania palustris TaxID=103762 RepID=A0A8J5RP20_ZIZPA|nr:hypothetical protein GUJ93_ZPchr0001g32621 [Zizania palustris]
MAGEQQRATTGAEMELPPGFRFHPSDEEIVTFYLTPKVLDSRGFFATAIGEVDLNKCEPWELPGKAKMIGEKEWYFYCHKDRKYPTGMRTNRATEAGYWKATGKDKEIFRNQDQLLIGMKKTLVFYRGRAPKGDKTNWVMHEYRLADSTAPPPASSSSSSVPTYPRHDDWAVCRIFHKTSGIKKPSMPTMQIQMPMQPLCPYVMPMPDLQVDDYSTALQMPPLMAPPPPPAPTSYSTLPAPYVGAPLPLQLPLPINAHQFVGNQTMAQFYQQQTVVDQMGGDAGFMADPASGPSSMVSQEGEQNNNNNNMVINNNAGEISSVAMACNMAAMDGGIWKY